MSLQYSSVFGMAQGLMPENGPKYLRYALDLTATGAADFDLTFEIMNDQIEFVQAVAIDNMKNTAALILTVGVSGHRVVCPPLSQGIFGIIGPAGPISFKATGAKVIHNLLFLNMPFAPSVYSVTAAT